MAWIRIKIKWILSTDLIGNTEIEVLPLPVRERQVVSTLAAALSRWNPFTALIASTSRVNTYSSPPLTCSGFNTIKIYKILFEIAFIFRGVYFS